MGSIKEILIDCPYCQNKIRFPKNIEGHVTNCPECDKRVELKIPKKNYLESLKTLDDTKPFITRVIFPLPIILIMAVFAEILRTEWIFYIAIVPYGFSTLHYFVCKEMEKYKKRQQEEEKKREAEQKLIEEEYHQRKKLYEAALDSLYSNNTPENKIEALEKGRDLAVITNQLHGYDRNITVFDEVALTNDINARTN